MLMARGAPDEPVHVGRSNLALHLGVKVDHHLDHLLRALLRVDLLLDGLYAREVADVLVELVLARLAPLIIELPLHPLQRVLEDVLRHAGAPVHVLAELPEEAGAYHGARGAGGR